MRICFIIEYYYPHVGGAEVLFQNLAEGLVKAGHVCEVITCRLPETEEFENINGVEVHRVKVPRLGDRYWFTLAGAPKAIQCAGRADIIHTMVYNGALPAKIAAMLRKKPVVVHVFEVIRSKWRLTGINPLLALAFRLLESMVLAIPFDAYSCISLSTRSALKEKGIPESRLFLAYPGIDYALFDPQRTSLPRDVVRRRLGVAEDAFLYTYYGRPGFVKGLHYLIAAVPLIKKHLPRAVLLLILSHKPDSGRRRVESLAQELHLQAGKDIIIIDPVPRNDLPAHIAASDCIVVPSLSEGFGFTCAEACAMKRPVVATTAGSLPEVISGRYVLVGPASAEALAEGVVRVSRNDYQRSEEKRFLWEDHVRKHEEVYQKLGEGRMIG
ncbi:MAG: glycosyltransferase family 4 protein [Nitrospirota bacterium]